MDLIGPLVSQEHGGLQRDDSPPEYGPPPAYGPPPERQPRPGHRRSGREYRYQGLPVHCTRVFQMDGSSDSDAEVSGKLIVLNLRSDFEIQPYNALSYAWGDSPQLIESITCGGRRLRVTPGLKEALRYIRAYGHRRDVEPLGRIASKHDKMQSYRNFASRPLWIDAICINQNDFDERSRQVLMMSAIYHYSMRVIVWLGVPNHGLQAELRRLSTMRLVRGRGRTSQQPGGFWSRLRGSREPQPPRRADLGAMLEEVLRLPWFGRRWVLQEMVFARDCDMLVGRFICSRKEMRGMLREFNLWERALPLRPHDTDCSLLTACWLYRNSRCGDPQDYVYALANMSPEGPNIHVDYNNSVRTVYFEMVAATVLRPRLIDMRPGTRELLRPRQHELLKMLAIATCQRRSPELNHRYDLEAWIPDWRQKAKFISENHRAAVKTCMSHLRDERSSAGHEDFSLPRVIEFNRSGWGYLWVRAKLLQPVEPIRTYRDGPSTQMQSSSQDKLERTLTSLLPVPQRESDCLWVAYLDNVNLIIGFTMRAGSTRASHRDRPVYRLHSCFIIETARLHRDWTPSDVSERFRRLRSFIVHSRAEFYLE